MNQAPAAVFKQVPVDHRLMIHVLPVDLRLKLKRFLPTQMFRTRVDFDATAANDNFWNDSTVVYLNWVLQDLYLLFFWKSGTKRSKTQKFQIHQARDLFSRLRSFLFESVAIVRHVDGIPQGLAYVVEYPPKLIEKIFEVYSNPELVFLREALKTKTRFAGELHTPAAQVMFHSKKPEQKNKTEWVNEAWLKLKDGSVTMTKFDASCLASAFFESSDASKKITIGDDPVLEYEGKLIEIFMKLIWSCFSLDEEDGATKEEDLDLAYRFYYLISSATWRDDAPDSNSFFLPEDYASSIQHPHLDYSFSRNRRIKKKMVNDLWSMDLPLTTEGCTILLWPEIGVGIPVHMKHGEMLLRAPPLIHSGGIPGRLNGDAFRLHGAVGHPQYKPEMNHQPQTFKEDEKGHRYYIKYTTPTAEVMMNVVNNRYN